MCRGSRDLRLLEHVMKMLKWVAEKQIKSMKKIDDMQLGFMQGRGTTDAIFILRELQETKICIFLS